MTALEIKDVLHVDDFRRAQRPPLAKLSKWPVRRLSQVTAVCVHQTAVAGGFGVLSYQIEAALAERKGSKLDPKVEGLLWRYRKTAYHGLYNPRHRVAVTQWHPKYRTNHGNGSNSYSVGWAYDGAFVESHSDDLDIDGGREALCTFIEHQRESGCPIRYLEGHCQHDDDRGDDPGDEIWRGIVIPVAKAQRLELREDYKTGTGRPVPKHWRNP